MIIPKSILIFALALNFFLLVQSIALEDEQGIVLALVSGLCCFLAMRLRPDEK